MRKQTAPLQTQTYLVDANVLIRYLEESDVRHTAAVNAIEGLIAQGHTLYLTSQSIIEFWAVASRPADVNGLGWDLARCNAALPLLLAALEFLPDTAAIFEEWRRLVTTYGVSGVQVHDTRLVAVMKTHNISGILTFNTKHFRRFVTGENIEVVDPTGEVHAARKGHTSIETGEINK